MIEIPYLEFNVQMKWHVSPILLERPTEKANYRGMNGIEK